GLLKSLRGLSPVPAKLRGPPLGFLSHRLHRDKPTTGLIEDPVRWLIRCDRQDLKGLTLVCRAFKRGAARGHRLYGCARRARGNDPGHANDRAPPPACDTLLPHPRTPLSAPQPVRWIRDRVNRVR